MRVIGKNTYKGTPIQELPRCLQPPFTAADDAGTPQNDGSFSYAAPEQGPVGCTSCQVRCPGRRDMGIAAATWLQMQFRARGRARLGAARAVTAVLAAVVQPLGGAGKAGALDGRVGGRAAAAA